MNRRLQNAIKEFTDFETTTVPHGFSIDYIVDRIRKNLQKAGVDAAALDPSGNSTAQQMETRIKKAAARCWILSARDEFYDLETTNDCYDTSFINQIDDEIRQFLQFGGAGLSALDPSGKSTDAQMDTRIENAKIRCHIMSARDTLCDLELTTTAYSATDVDSRIKDIREHLKLANASAAALDPNGNSTAQQQEQRILNAEARAKSLGQTSAPTLTAASSPISGRTYNMGATGAAQLIKAGAKRMNAALSPAFASSQETEGASVNAPDPQAQKTADWMKAAQEGDVAKIKEMLKAGTAVNTPDKDGFTALDKVMEGKFDAGLCGDLGKFDDTIAALKKAGGMTRENVRLKAAAVARY